MAAAAQQTRLDRLVQLLAGVRASPLALASAPAPALVLRCLQVRVVSFERCRVCFGHDSRRVGGDTATGCPADRDAA